jgi:hypothetical protein
MLGVEHHDAKLLHLSGSELRQQVTGHIAWRDELQPSRGASKQCPPSQFDRGENLRRFCGAHSGHAAKIVDMRPRNSVKTACVLENLVCKRQRVPSTGAAADDDRNQFVVPESRRSQTKQLLARPIVERQGLHVQSGILNEMPRRFSFVVLAGILCSSIVFAGCAAPPTREMDQAQGAIDAARAAGADRYAATQYEAAVKALKSAHDAVAARDYRLALNHALDSGERAQTAAKEAASQQVALRSSAERRLAQAAPRAAIAEAEASLQKAGTGIQEGEYRSSQERLSESATKLQAAMAEIETTMKGRGGKPRR